MMLHKLLAMGLLTALSLSYCAVDSVDTRTAGERPTEIGVLSGNITFSDNSELAKPVYGTDRKIAFYLGPNTPSRPSASRPSGGGHTDRTPTTGGPTTSRPGGNPGGTAHGTLPGPTTSGGTSLPTPSTGGNPFDGTLPDTTPNDMRDLLQSHRDLFADQEKMKELMEQAGVTEADINRMIHGDPDRPDLGRIPLGWPADTYEQFVREYNDLMTRLNIANTALMIGSSTTFLSSNPSKNEPGNPHFYNRPKTDDNGNPIPAGPPDVDIELTAPTLAQVCDALGCRRNEQYGVYGNGSKDGEKGVHDFFPQLKAFEDKWKAAGYDVDIKLNMAPTPTPVNQQTGIMLPELR
jgi:hypothetical protein